MEQCDIVIPVYNEEGNVDELYRQIIAVMSGVGITYAIIFVDDGSTDHTLGRIENLANVDSRVKFISFTRNFGQQAALKAGLEHSSGDCVITIDGDLQHPPQRIPEMIRLWQNGYPVVSSVKEANDWTPLFRKLTDALFYKAVNLITGLRIVPGSADFRLLDKDVVKAILRLKKKNEFLRGAIHCVDFKNTSISYRVQKRFAGRTKYTFFKRIRLAWDSIMAFSAIGLLGEYVAKILGGHKERPSYAIKEKKL